MPPNPPVSVVMRCACFGLGAARSGSMGNRLVEIINDQAVCRTLPEVVGCLWESRLGRNPIIEAAYHFQDL